MYTVPKLEDYSPEALDRVRLSTRADQHVPRIRKLDDYSHEALEGLPRPLAALGKSGILTQLNNRLVETRALPSSKNGLSARSIDTGSKIAPWLGQARWVGQRR